MTSITIAHPELLSTFFVLFFVLTGISGCILLVIILLSIFRKPKVGVITLEAPDGTVLESKFDLKTGKTLSWDERNG